MRIGPYEVKARLGRGGMGDVFLARHDPTGNLVALKRARDVDSLQLASLRREIHALSRLRHPGIVRLVDHGVADGLPWCALEFVDGETLHATLHDPKVRQGAGDQGPVPTTATAIAPEETTEQSDELPFLPERQRAGAGSALQKPAVLACLAAVKRLCEPLAFLHGEGIVHCDLKPANIVMRPDGSPVIIDFGQIVHFSGPHGRERLDETFIPVGTYDYMAPERVRRELVDARADLYAVGCMLYEILTGRPPFVGDPRMVLRQHIAVRPVAPSRIVAGISPAIDDLVLRLLEKDPRARIGYADSIAAALKDAGIEDAAAASKEQPDSLGELASSRRPPVARAYLYRPTFAGQAAPLRSIVKEPGGLVFIAAESGAGKTRLALEAGRTLAGEMRVVAGECMPLGADSAVVLGAPLHPITPLLRVIADECRSQGPGMTEMILGRRGRVLADYEPTLLDLPDVAALPAPARLSPEAAQQRLYSDLAETLFAFAILQRLMLILDDLQWADELTLGFLRSLTPATLADQGVLIIGTFRKDEAIEPLWRLAAQPGVRTISLARLDRSAVAKVACDMLALSEPPAPLVDRLFASSDGNPFFVAEYLRAAVEEGLLVRDAQGSWRAGLELGDLARLPVPGSVRDLLEGRLDALGPDAKLWVTAASVLGRELDREILERMVKPVDAAPDAPPATGRARLVAAEELLARQILEEVPRGFRFVHDMLREVSYERIPPARRRELHLSAAVAIEREYEARGQLPSMYAALAHHYGAADVDDKTFLYLERAASSALASGAYVQARALLSRLLALDGTRGRPSAPIQRARWCRWLGEAAYALGDLTGLEAHTARGLAELGRPPPHSALTWAGAFASELIRQLSGARGPRGVAEGDGAARAEIAQMAAQLAIRYYFAGSAGALVTTSLLAVNEAEAAGAGSASSAPRGLSRPYAYLGYLTGLLRLRSAAASYLRRAEEIGRAANDPDGVAYVFTTEAVYRLCLCDWAAARRAAEEALRIQLAHANSVEAGLLETILGHIEYFTGDFGASRRRFEALAVAAKRHNNEQHRAWGLYSMARCDLAEGRADAALPLLREAESSLQSLSDEASELIVDGLFAAAHIARGDLSAAVHSAERIARRIDRAYVPTVFSTVHAYVALAEVRLHVWEGGAKKSAAPALRACALLAAFAAMFPLARPAAERCGARARALLGGDASRGLSRSAETARRLGMPHEEALALREQRRP